MCVHVELITVLVGGKVSFQRAPHFVLHPGPDAREIRGATNLALGAE